jgi:acetoin utilization deacetylase AcuC-like enzyme
MIKLAYSDQYFYPLPEGHKFPMEKYALVKDQLLYEGCYLPDQIIDPGLADEALVQEIHSPDYYRQLKEGNIGQSMQRKIGLPLHETSFKRSLNSVAGTIKAADWALETGLGLNLAGGTHHAYSDKGEGFSMLNDLAVTSHYLLHYRKIKRILVVDLDVHQGNGTAKIFENDTRVFTFSMHGKDNYPLKKEKSDLDIELPSQTGDTEYLAILRNTLPALIESQKPDFILFQAGVDVLASDKLGRLALSLNGCKLHDEIVFECCEKYQIPIATVMGGGYSNSLRELVEAHCNTFRMANLIFG